jgi:hypothetical protein
MVSFCCSSNNFPMTVTNGVEIHSLSQLHSVYDNQKINHQTDYQGLQQTPPPWNTTTTHKDKTMAQRETQRERERETHTHTHTLTCTTIVSLSLSLLHIILSLTLNILSQIQLSHQHINTSLSQFLLSLSLTLKKTQASKDGKHIWLWVSLWWDFTDNSQLDGCWWLVSQSQEDSNCISATPPVQCNNPPVEEETK